MYTMYLQFTYFTLVMRPAIYIFIQQDCNPAQTASCDTKHCQLLLCTHALKWQRATNIQTYDLYVKHMKIWVQHYKYWHKNALSTGPSLVYKVTLVMIPLSKRTKFSLHSYISIKLSQVTKLSPNLRSFPKKTSIRQHSKGLWMRRSHKTAIIIEV